eukprot:8344426-Ditylum_brightwellii.AAC.1
MATFILNQYDGDIDLSNKEGRKLYNAGCTGVKKGQKFDGSKERCGSGMGCSNTGTAKPKKNMF